MAAGSDYKDYSTDDFIKDENFQRWIYSPNEESTAFWNRFIGENPTKARDVEEARRFLRLLNFDEGDVFQSKINALKERIDAAIDDPGHTVSPDEEAPFRGKTTSRVSLWWKVAASITLLALVIWLVRDALRVPSPEGQLALREQRTANGERTLISLEDGTRIWLNVASRIQYPEHFAGSATREVYLEGEAFFEVSGNKSKPFIVRTQAVQIRVLGTSFNVKSYDKEDEIQTTLVEGKLTVESIDDQPKVVTLAPNQVATYHKESKKIVLNNQADAAAHAGWKDGRLIFDNRPLAEIVLALERWYDVKITVEDEQSLKCHYSAKVENLTLKEVLELFRVSDDIEYTIEGREVIIKGSICDN